VNDISSDAMQNPKLWVRMGPFSSVRRTKFSHLLLHAVFLSKPTSVSSVVP